MAGKITHPDLTINFIFDLSAHYNCRCLIALSSLPDPYRIKYTRSFRFAFCMLNKLSILCCWLGKKK